MKTKSCQQNKKNESDRFLDKQTYNVWINPDSKSFDEKEPYESNYKDYLCL